MAESNPSPQLSQAAGLSSTPSASATQEATSSSTTQPHSSPSQPGSAQPSTTKPTDEDEDLDLGDAEPAAPSTPSQPTQTQHASPPQPSPPNLDGTTDPPAHHSTPSGAIEPTAPGAASGAAAAGLSVDDTALAQLEAKIPAKRDATLRQFLSKMDECGPIIPDALTAHYLTLAGLPPPPETPLHLARLLALATQKFVSDVAADAYQFARIRTSGHNTGGGGGGGGYQGAGAPAQGSAGQGDGGKAAAAARGVQLGLPRPGFGGGGQASGSAASAMAGVGAGGAGGGGMGAYSMGGGAGGGSREGGGRTVLTLEDLGCAVGEYGVNVRRGEFYR